MTALLPSFWHLFSGLQRLTNASILNSHTWGTEEALDSLLGELPQDEGVLVTHLVLQRFRNLRRNRTAKHRHRQHMLSALARDEGHRGAPADPADRPSAHAQPHAIGSPLSAPLPALQALLATAPATGLWYLSTALVCEYSAPPELPDETCTTHARSA
jgi:hypothetical protein